MTQENKLYKGTSNTHHTSLFGGLRSNFKITTSGQDKAIKQPPGQERNAPDENRKLRIAIAVTQAIVYASALAPLLSK